MDSQSIIKKLRQYYLLNHAKYGIKRMALFGSAARGQMTPQSDLDIIVDLEKPDLFVLSDIKQDIEEIFSLHVDIVRQRKDMNSFLGKRIEQEAIYV